jgi:ferritin-like metal-binding protein YciE
MHSIVQSAEADNVQLNTLEELYVAGLKDLYSAEKQLLRALPKMAKAASHSQLKEAFRTHLRQTEEHVARLDRISQDLGKKLAGKKCIGMEGLIDEGNELVQEKPNPDVLDAGLIDKAQHVEHYEMAGYGTCRTYAQQLGYDKQAALLQQTLNEEGETDKLLTALAESSINIEAEYAPEKETTARGRGREPTSRREQETARTFR